MKKDDVFRAEQVGSLLRPEPLLTARHLFAEGKMTDQELREIEDEQIRKILSRQESIGIDVLSDGEFRRTAFMTGFMDAVDGFSLGEAVAMPWKGGVGQEHDSPNSCFVTGKVRCTRRIAQTEASFLSELVPGRFKITLPSPVSFAMNCWRKGKSDAVYPTPSDFVLEVAQILAAEARQLAEEGVPYIQIDAPAYTHWADDSLKADYRGAGFEMEQLLGDCIRAENTILDAIPDSVVTAVHLCRGNSMGRWLAEGGYEPLAEKLFTQLNCDRLLLEYDDYRSGGFEPLRLVPGDKAVVLGLISSKTGELESRDMILRRIEDAANYIPMERLALSPQCGFASSGLGNPLSEEEQWKKLELVASIADEVWH
jgi:5-methyltetrahydropteroyltriglutamate--homocysteine methyltransferase